MAYTLSLKGLSAIVLLLCMISTCCKSDGDPIGITDRALECFNDRYVYSRCQEDYRLSAEGIIHVPPEAVDEYCTGPCLAETKLVLKCINGILYNFRFYNGATVKDISYTLETGCGNTDRRGDFDILENIGEGFGDYFGHGNVISVCHTHLVIVFSILLLQWL